MFDALISLGFLAVWLYGLIDCARSDQDAPRNLPKWAWLLIIIFIFPFGAIAWLVVGRSKSTSQPRLRPRRILPPDDNPEFLKKL